MTRAIKFALVYGYLVAAAMTFNFAVPIDCDHVVTRAEFNTCVGKNVLDSAKAAIVWPVYWAGRVL